MLTKIAIYLFLYPLSLLPMTILYGIGKVIRFFMYTLFSYRKKVVQTNLRNSFPDFSKEELKQIEQKYYTHLCNLFVEGIKLLSISRKNLMLRYVCKNPELVNQYFDAGKSVILMSAHYNNWEWLVLSLAMQFKHHGVGVGKENSNKSFEKTINKFRTRYGTEVIFAKTIREVVSQYDENKKLTAYMMLSDQAPNSVKKPFVTSFLHQPSNMIYGSEYFALKYNYPVLYYVVKQKKRGYYEFELELITNNPSSTTYGEITKKYVSLLERDIKNEPIYWLWSHRRWKHKVELPNKNDL